MHKFTRITVATLFVVGGVLTAAAPANAVNRYPVTDPHCHCG